MQRRQSSPLKFFIPLIGIAAIISVLIFIFVPTQAKQAKNLVDSFYMQEQKADYDSSWKLFHPEMKKRFSQKDYIQDRIHTFMGHFGADTFTYSLTKPNKIVDWKMTNDSDPIEVYEIVVTKEYKAKYGHFQFVQYVYVSFKDKEPGILWDFKE